MLSILLPRKKRKEKKNLITEFKRYENLKCKTCIFRVDGCCNNPESDYCNRKVPEEAFCHWWEDGGNTK